MKRNIFLNGNEYQLSEKFDWGRIVEAFTDEDKALNFPIKYPAIDFDKATKQTIINTALIIGGSLVVMGAIIGYARKK